MRVEPRWLDTRAAAYISVDPDRMLRLAKEGRIPEPTYQLVLAAGILIGQG